MLHFVLCFVKLFCNTYFSVYAICSYNAGGVSQFFQTGFCQDLEKALGNKVDVITTAGLSGSFKEQVEKEMILIYE